MRFNCLCLCLLALVMGLGVAAGYDVSISQSMEVSETGFDEEFVKSLFGFGAEGGEGFWFGPEFEDVSTATTFFSEFYMESSVPVVKTFAPVKIDVTQNVPSRIYFGSGKEIAYTQYQSTVATSRGNELWIQKGADWSQYAIVPAGSGIQFIAFAPVGGQADYYWMLQSNSLNITSKRLDLYPGYNSLNFKADEVGRHILLFVLNNQPSNAIIIDVISQAPPAQQTAVAADMPPSTNNPAASGVQATQTVQPTQAVQMPTGATTSVMQTYSGTAQQTTSASSTTQYPAAVAAKPAVPAIVAGDTPVTIQTTLKGYDVYVDGVLIGKEGTGGDLLDGVFKFKVVGGMIHNIRVFDGEHNYPKDIYFERGVQKIINVPPGTTVYGIVTPYH
ncbi:MAG: hypothetical protein PHH76_00810 [Methanothrix soehngenii]|uniref:hypothetical protein n=2 Tax=Methanothrix soehngenii TaxID=2223 RepID=UPI0023F27C79|nr:hypothetical protein [Methanothrix soehngenii]MDD5256087.1 hypothetical protein [Methanothrix soehngenii]